MLLPNASSNKVMESLQVMDVAAESILILEQVSAEFKLETVGFTLPGAQSDTPIAYSRTRAMALVELLHI